MALKSTPDESAAPSEELPLATAAALAVDRQPFLAEGRDVCLFVAFAPEGRLRPCAAAIVAALSAAGVDVIVCAAVTSLADPFDGSGASKAAGLVRRVNGGFDFAAWASLLDAFPQVWAARRLYFANDSMLGPMRSFSKMLARTRGSVADLVALTESPEVRRHAQSYFFMLQNRALTHPLLRAHWAGIRSLNNKFDVIHAYEIPMLALVTEKAGLTADILFPAEVLAKAGDGTVFLGGNPAHHAWRVLLNAGLPFIKAELLVRNPGLIDVTGWEVAVEEHGGDLAAFRRHIRLLEEQLGPPPAPTARERAKRLLRTVAGQSSLDRLLRLYRQLRYGRSTTG